MPQPFSLAHKSCSWCCQTSWFSPLCCISFTSSCSPTYPTSWFCPPCCTYFCSVGPLGFLRLLPGLALPLSLPLQPAGLALACQHLLTCACTPLAAMCRPPALLLLSTTRWLLLFLLLFMQLTTSRWPTLLLLVSTRRWLLLCLSLLLLLLLAASIGPTLLLLLSTAHLMLLCPLLLLLLLLLLLQLMHCQMSTDLLPLLAASLQCALGKVVLHTVCEQLPLWLIRGLRCSRSHRGCVRLLLIRGLRGSRAHRRSMWLLIRGLRGSRAHRRSMWLLI